MDRQPTARDEPGGVAFWTSVAVGLLLIGWGTYLFVDSTPDLARRVDLAVWLVGSALAHDLLVAPVVAGVGLVLARLAPPAWRPPVQVGVFASAIVLLVAAAPLAGTAAPVGNPTIQPLDYTTATVTVLGVVWGAVAAWLAARALRRRRSRRQMRAITGSDEASGPIRPG